MKQGPSRDANSRSVRKEISRLPRNTEVHYHRHKKTSLVPIDNQVNPALFLKHYPPTCLQQVLSVPSGFPTKILYVFLILPMHATSPARNILIYLITPTKTGEQYIFRSFSLCNFLQPSQLSPSWLHKFSAPWSRKPAIAVLSLWRETKVHTHTKRKIQTIVKKIR
jgi:hypothetical protein